MQPGMLNFDARTVAPATGNAGQLPVSEGDLGHVVVIKGEAIKPTSKNDGSLLELTLEIIDGPHKGATGPYRLNLWNPSSDAVRIAQQSLSAICHVVGVFQLPQGTQPLWGKPFRVVVKPQTDPKYTEVKMIQDVNGNPPGHAGGAAPQQQPPQAQQAPQGYAPQAAPAAQQYAPQPPAPAPYTPTAQQYAPQSQPQAFGGGQPAPAAPVAPAPAQWQPGAPAPAAAGGAPPWARQQ